MKEYPHNIVIKVGEGQSPSGKILDRGTHWYNLSSYIEAINYAVCSGCRGVFTAHGNSLEDVMLNPVLKNLLNLHVFEKIIFLNTNVKGNIKEVYKLNKKNATYEKAGDK